MFAGSASGGSYNHRSGSNASLKDIGKAPASDHIAHGLDLRHSGHTHHPQPAFGPSMKEDCFTWVIPRRVTTTFTIFNIKGIHSGFGQYWCIRGSLILIRAGNPLPAVPTVHRARIAQHARLRIPLTEAKQTIGSFPHSACYSTVLVSGVQVSRNKSQCTPYSPTSTRPRSHIGTTH